MRLVNDPIAAALTCAYNKVICSNNVLIFDLGGGSLNVGHVDIDVEWGETIVSKAIGGDKNLGGLDFDYIMVDHFVKEIKNEIGINIGGNSKALSKLKRACEMAKRTIFFENKAEFLVEMTN
jgi:L1 cell adhesion molecule like protein